MRKVYHLVDRFDADPATEKRCMTAYASHDTLYERGELIPIHAWPESYPRTADKMLGDPRPLPYLKDLFRKFLETANQDDICLWGNSDTILHPLIAEYARFHCSVYGPCSFFRADFRTPPSLDLSPENYGKRSIARHIGRDAFAFTHEWLADRFNDMPDFILGAANWDLCLAAMVRLEYGIRTNAANLGTQILPAEPPVGYVGHISHASEWHKPNLRESPSNLWNGKCFAEWAEINAPEMKFTKEMNLSL